MGWSALWGDVTISTEDSGALHLEVCLREDHEKLHLLTHCPALLHRVVTLLPRVMWSLQAAARASIGPIRSIPKAGALPSPTCGS